MVARVHNAGLVDVQITPEDPHPWMEDRNCRNIDTEIFFERANSVDAPGKEYCTPCPVKHECLMFTLLRENPFSRRYGYVGDMGPSDRDKLYKELQARGKVTV